MKKMRKKRLALLLAAVFGISALSGCGMAGTSNSERGGVETMRLMVWAPSGDQSKDKGEWLQTCCKNFAKQHPEYDIDFVYGVADEATAADSVTQDAEASADVFMFANDNITKLTNAKAAAKFGGIYADQIMETNSEAVTDSVRVDGLRRIPGLCIMTSVCSARTM